MSSILILVSILGGWLAGWLINYLSDVLPVTRRFSRPACQRCAANIEWSDYLLFRPCPNGHRRTPRTWLVQILGAAISVYIWIHPPSIGYIPGIILTIYFGVVFVIDMEHRLILHPTSIFGSFLGLWVGAVSHGLYWTLLGGLAGLAIMLAFYFFGMLFTRLRARRLQASGQETDEEEALGAGDVILAAILGLILGWPMIWFGILAGVLLGGAGSMLFLLWLFATRQYQKNALMIFIPYGPYFIISAFLIIYFPRLLAALLPK